MISDPDDVKASDEREKQKSSLLFRSARLMCMEMKK
jgi:hypothetical protein